MNEELQNENETVVVEVTDENLSPDGETVELTQEELLQQLIELHGEDSPTFKELQEIKTAVNTLTEQNGLEQGATIENSDTLLEKMDLLLTQMETLISVGEIVLIACVFFIVWQLIRILYQLFAHVFFGGL